MTGRDLIHSPQVGAEGGILPRSDLDFVTSAALNGHTLDVKATQTKTLLVQGPAQNVKVSPEWAHKVVILGAGSYGTSIGQRLAIKLLGEERDVILWDRNPDKVAEINNRHSNSRAVGNEILSENLLATTSLHEALLDRGIIIIALASGALPDVLKNIRPHPESTIVSLTKGFVIPTFDPFSNPQALVRGPSEGSSVYTPLQFIRTLPYWKDLEQVVAVAGPGFAKNIVKGPALSKFGLTAASHSETGCRKAGHMLHDAGIKMRLSRDPLGVEIAAAMKNVVAIATGVVGGLRDLDGRKIYGPEEHELVKQMGMEEILRFSKWLAERVERLEGIESQVKHRTQHTFAGWPDLNLTTGNIESRNTRVGHQLAEGKGIFEIIEQLKKKDQTAEGVTAAWGAKRLTDPHALPDGSFEPGLQMPLTNALIDLMQQLITPRQFVDALLTEPLGYHYPDDGVREYSIQSDSFRPRPFVPTLRVSNAN